MINATFFGLRSAPPRMLLSGTTQYAIRAVVHVAEHAVDEPLRVDEIAAALDVPRNYLSKTLHQLVRAGVLRSGRGPRGGFQLAEAPEALTLARVAAPFDDLAQRKCLLGRATCTSRSPCSAHGRWEKLSSAMLAFFGRTTIADLMAEIAERPSTAPANDRRASKATARKASPSRARPAGRTRTTP
ncbi:MAG: Rrf2 family transcriptional regulator [Gemmatimonadetes bacterium]|nr:Rrf2 family transcriptional regulator [Gemmatimonadota bacterium]